MPGNRLKSNQPQSILRLIFHISRDKGTRSGNSLSYPVRRIAATAGTIKKAADRASSVCRKQEYYLKWELLLTKKLWDVLFLLWGFDFPRSRHRPEGRRRISRKRGILY